MSHQSFFNATHDESNRFRLGEVEESRGPDFLCIGAQKAGTTWLHENLSKHDGIWLPPVKELHVLDHDPPALLKRIFGKASHHRLAREHLWNTIKNGTNGRDLRLALSIAFGRRDLSWYDSLFEYGGAKVKGEICPGYARVLPDGVKRIHARYPRAKIIYLLRDPISRAWSSMAMHFRKAGDGSVNEHNDDAIVSKLMSPKSLGHCVYSRNIEAWTSHYPEGQVYFGFFDRIVEDPQAYLSEIARFIGVQPQGFPQYTGERVNGGQGESMPRAVRYRLAQLLLPECEALCKRFDNRYTAQWLESARADLLAGPPVSNAT